MRILLIVLALLVFLLAAPAAGQVPAVSAQYRDAVIRESRATGGLLAPSAMFAGQLMQESSFIASRRSPAGAQGLAQFMPGTATWLTQVAPKDFPTANSLDPQWAIRALVYYDYWLYARTKMFAESDENHWAAALASYNGGLGYVQKDARRTGSGDWWNVVSAYDDGRTTANLKENRDYPQHIIRLWEPKFHTAGW